MVQTLIPRPIAWVLSENPDSSYNLAPFSYFNAISSSPPLIVLSLGKKPDGTAKDSCVNILKKKYFTVHIAHSEMLEDLNESSKTLAAGESELEMLKLSTTDFENAPVPRLTDCRIAYACEYYQHHELGDTPQSVIYAKVNNIFLDENIISTDERGHIKVHADKLNPIARLGANEYMTFGQIIQLKRPS